MYTPGAGVSASSWGSPWSQKNESWSGVRAQAAQAAAFSSQASRSVTATDACYFWGSGRGYGSTPMARSDSSDQPASSP